MTQQEIQRSWISTDCKDVLFRKVSTVRSRYDSKFRIIDENDRVVVRPARGYDVYIPRSRDDSYYVITNADQYRPDILAQRFYNDPRMYWVLLAANNMKTVFEFESGINIRIPAYETIYSGGGVMMR